MVCQVLSKGYGKEKQRVKEKKTTLKDIPSLAKDSDKRLKLKKPLTKKDKTISEELLRRVSSKGEVKSEKTTNVETSRETIKKSDVCLIKLLVFMAIFTELLN
ncbi:MAG: hypothetical protein ACTS3T_02060 [Almyronema sp.]